MEYENRSTLKYLGSQIENFNSNGMFIYYTIENVSEIKNFLRNPLHARIIKNVLLKFDEENFKRAIPILATNLFQNNVRLDAIEVGKLINGRFYLNGQRRHSKFEFPQTMNNLERYSFKVSAFHYPPKVRKIRYFYKTLCVKKISSMYSIAIIKMIN